MRACQNTGMDFKELLGDNNEPNTHKESLRMQKIIQVSKLVKDMIGGRG